ncbi:hypothetical protein ACVBEQ_08180 [Nakamurella sp. GG22]
MDATETHARIQSLIDAGHPIPELARAMGKSAVSLRRTLSRQTVTAQTAASVSSLYDRMLSNTRAADQRNIRSTAPFRV